MIPRIIIPNFCHRDLRKSVKSQTVKFASLVNVSYFINGEIKNKNL